MYKAIARWMITRNIERLNAGDHGPVLAMYSPEARFSFPGDNSWATMFQPHQRGRTAVATHRGRQEIEAFLRRFTELGIQLVIEDILVNGPPWRARAAVRCHDFAPGDGGDVYTNRAVLWIETRWGRIVEHEDYEDTERSAAYDTYLEATAATASSARSAAV